jgi:hypothetical protein
MKLLETLEIRVLKRLVIGRSTPSPGDHHSKELRGKSRDRMLAKSPTAITHAYWDELYGSQAQPPRS